MKLKDTKYSDNKRKAIILYLIFCISMRVKGSWLRRMRIIKIIILTLFFSLTDLNATP